MVTSAIFGSGVSYASQIPSVAEITERILTGRDVGRESDGNYYIGAGQDFLKHHCDDNLKLISFIKDYIEDFYLYLGSNHVVNYEDIYYVLRQILDSLVLEFENPVVLALINQILSRDELKEKQLKRAMMEATHYIECMVWQMISLRKFTCDQFDIIPDLLEKLHLKHIFSLNHDLVLEEFLKNKGILYRDGFKDAGYKFQQWTEIEESDDELNLLKLHGSVDWFEFGIRNPNRNEIFKITNNLNPNYAHRYEQSFVMATDGTPKLLIGTFNKMLGYLSDIFEIIYDEFKRRLADTTVLLVSGYGFGDKGINTQIANWLNYDTAIKMVIIHPNIETLQANARGNFHLNILNAYGNHPKVEFIEKKFEMVTFEDISRVVD